MSMNSTETKPKDLARNQKKVTWDTTRAGVRNAPRPPRMHDMGHIVFGDEDITVDTTMDVIKNQANAEARAREEVLTPTVATKEAIAKLLGANQMYLEFTARFTGTMEQKVSWDVVDSELRLKAGHSLIAVTIRELRYETGSDMVATELTPELYIVMNKFAKAKRFILSFGRKNTNAYNQKFEVRTPSDVANYLKK
jgi:hypothetical protein